MDDTYKECLQDLEKIENSFSLPPEVINRIYDIIYMAEDSPKEKTAERVTELIKYQYEFIDDKDKADRVRRHLNDVISKLYGNHYTQR